MKKSILTPLIVSTIFLLITLYINNVKSDLRIEILNEYSPTQILKNSSAVIIASNGDTLHFQNRIKVFDIKISNRSRRPVKTGDHSEKSPIAIKVHNAVFFDPPEILKTSDDYSFENVISQKNDSIILISNIPFVKNDYVNIRLFCYSQNGDFVKISPLGKLTSQKEFSITELNSEDASSRVRKFRPIRLLIFGILFYPFMYMSNIITDPEKKFPHKLIVIEEISGLALLNFMMYSSIVIVFRFETFGYLPLLVFKYALAYSLFVVPYMLYKMYLIASANGHRWILLNSIYTSHEMQKIPAKDQK